jgi:hypothetical protein
MIRCDLCPHHCVLKEGQTGFCHQRINKEGRIVLNVDPMSRTLNKKALKND